MTPKNAQMQGVLEQLHAEVTGPEGAPPALLLHGWGSSGELMRAAGAPLEETHKIYNLDLPGHGKTPPPPDAWGVPEYAALVEAYIQEAGISPVPVIGHSNGGRIALHMAQTSSTAHLFSHLILISPSGVKSKHPVSYYVKTAWISTLKAPFRLLPDGPLRQRCLAWLRTTIYWKLAASSDYAAASGVMRETFVKTVRHFVTDGLRHITAPALLVWGEQDTSISLTQMRILEKGIPDATLVILNGAGHYAYLDSPREYAEAVKKWLVDRD